MPEHTGGGTGIMLRDKFKLTLVEGKERLSFESSEWNVSANVKTTKFVIVYRPPYSEAHPVPTSVFFDEFAVYLEDVVMCPEVLVIAGDFNLHIDDPKNADTRRFFELLETFGLVQHVNFSKHVSGHWLDLIITRSSNDIMVMSPKPSLFLSDHCFIECSLAIPSAAVEEKQVSFRRWKKVDLTALQKDIAALNDLPVPDLVENYDLLMQAVADKHAPIQNKLVIIRPRVPWYSDDLRRMKTQRRRLERKMRKTKLPSGVSLYRKICDEYCLLLKDAKTKYYNELIQGCEGDSKKLFRAVNSLRKERSVNLIPPHTSQLQLADDFGEFFCSKISRIREDITSSSVPSINISVPSPEVKLETFAHVSEDAVRKIILSRSDASCHLDPIPTWLVKKCVDIVTPIISKMINFSLDGSCIPNSWKNALVIPLIKKLDTDPVFENFRPVSNLSFVSKIAKKAVISQLLNHCNEHVPLPTNQSLYRQFHSTETALIKVQSDILSSMDRQDVTLLVLLDLSAAFDTVNHETIAALLESDFGVASQGLLWIKSFLSSRKQRVVVEQKQSRDFDAATGVPQGSCLGPILFIMYASRLFHVVKKHLPNIQCYADDRHSIILITQT